MSGNEAADYTKRDAALLLLGAVATAWTALVLWQWGSSAVESGFPSPPLIKAEEAGPFRRLPEDPGGEKVPNANRELQLAITAPDPATVWQNSTAIKPAEPVPGPTLVRHASSPLDGPAASSSSDLIQPSSVDSTLIQPLPEESPVQSASGEDAANPVPNPVPNAFLQPPERRPGA